MAVAVRDGRSEQRRKGVECEGGNWPPNGDFVRCHRRGQPPRGPAHVTLLISLPSTNVRYRSRSARAIVQISIQRDVHCLTCYRTSYCYHEPH